MRPSDVIAPGDKIDIKTTRQKAFERETGQESEVLQSCVSDFVSDTELEISMPTQGGKMVLLQVGEPCDFLFYTKKGMYRCSGSVRGRYRKDNLYLSTIQIESLIIKFQRREFFRVEYMTDIKYYEISAEVAALKTTADLCAEVKEKDYGQKIRTGTLLDISGGGVKFTSNARHNKGDFIFLLVHLTCEKVNDTFYLVCQIVESGRHASLQNTYSTRAKFIFKDLKDREKIVRFVFEEERRLRQKENG